MSMVHSASFRVGLPQIVILSSGIERGAAPRDVARPIAARTEAY